MYYIKLGLACVFVYVLCDTRYLAEGSESGSWNISVNPESLAVIQEGEDFNLTLFISHSYSSTVKNQGEYELLIINKSPNKLTLVSNDSLKLPGNILTEDFATYITIRGRQVGKSQLWFEIRDGQEGNVQSNITANYLVHVLLRDSVLSQIFNIGVLVSTALMTLAFACTLELDEVKKVFAKPWGLIIGFVCQYGFMPAFAYAMGRAFSLDSAMAFGLFCMGCCPGGGTSNMWTSLVHGKIDLSISMTLVSSITALGMMPLWLFTLGKLMIENLRRETPEIASGVTIPFVEILVTIALVVVPCTIGILISRFLPKVGKIIGRIIRPVAIIFLLFQVVLGIFTRMYIFDYFREWNIVLGCMLLPYTAMLVSFSVAMIFRQGLKASRTIMIETAIQNAALSISLVLAALPSPDADIAMVAPLIALIANPIVLTIISVGFAIYDCVRRRKTKNTEKKPIVSTGISRQSAAELFESGSKHDKDIEREREDMFYLTNQGAHIESVSGSNVNVISVKQLNLNDQDHKF